MVTTEIKTNIASNYRRMFKQRYGVAYTGPDENIIRYWQSASGAPSAEDQDTWVLEDMQDA